MPLRRWLVLALLALLTLLAARPAAADDLSRRYLASIDVVAARPSLKSPIELRIEVSDPAELVAWLGKRHQARTDPDGKLHLVLRRYEAEPTPPGPAQRKPSFLIDIDEPPFQPVHALAAKIAAHPTPEQLTRFVGDYISNKNTMHGWDLTSTVAKTHAGDCTEHATLLAGVLRSFGYGARVVGGLVLITVEKRVVAFGHAWVEVGDGDGWRPLDATRPGETPDHTYLPLFVVSNESLSFERDLLGALVRMPHKVFLP